MLRQCQSTRKAYCPPIDDAVFYALASDYHGSDLIDILDKLKASALEEENTAFDPSGTGGAIQQLPDLAGWPLTAAEDTSTSNDLTNLTSDLGDLRLQEDGTNISQLEPEERVELLLGLFPSLSFSRIRNVCSTFTSSDQAIEELLNLSFLADEADALGNQELPKGIDCYAEDFRAPRQKGRRRRKNDKRDSSLDGSPASTFADKEGTKWNKLDKVDEILEQQIAEIKPLFPNVSDARIFGLLRLTRYMPSAVHELLTVMTALGRDERELTQDVTDMIQYAPLTLASNEQPLAALHDEKWTKIRHRSPRQNAATRDAAVDQAFEQASQAYKKSKSNHLYGGAAAYYSQLGHEQLKKAKAVSVAEANTIADTQSTATSLDLHGINVQNAVRIAQYKTQQWWDGLGDTKYAPGGGGPTRAGYRIITGVGTHKQFRVLRQKGTEPAFTGEYDKHYPDTGVYTCAGCNAPLYQANHKFKSGCGWPAYFDSIPGAVTRHTDSSYGMERTEIVCSNCGGHLGHVFKGEGFPTPTDERHCVNSISLKFSKDDPQTTTTAEAGKGEAK
ncbi:hypothetical protein DV737_g2768, partial [Chaetothyriales sp. CBS 132003]